jgi:hypothetical protein
MAQTLVFMAQMHARNHDAIEKNRQRKRRSHRMKHLPRFRMDCLKARVRPVPERELDHPRTGSSFQVLAVLGLGVASLDPERVDYQMENSNLLPEHLAQASVLVHPP